MLSNFHSYSFALKLNGKALHRYWDGTFSPLCDLLSNFNFFAQIKVDIYTIEGVYHFCNTSFQEKIGSS